MLFVRLTRPDGSQIASNTSEIVHAAPVPASGELAGSLTEGSRIVFRNQSHQDVRELLDEVMSRIEMGRSAPSHAVAGCAPETRAAAARRISRKNQP